MQESKHYISRIVSSIVILIIFLFSIIYSKLIFAIVMSCVLCFMIWEWYRVTIDHKYYLPIGIIIFIATMFFIVSAHFLSKDFFLIMTYFFIIWTVDTMAFVGGKIIGGPKIAPKISPNKTISGFIVGIVSGGIMAVLLSTLAYYDPEMLVKFNIKTSLGIFFFGFFLGILAQMSDLLMSYFKRVFGVKDYSNIIPGHGGVVDRFDSTILTSPILYYLVI